jgi:catechol 2,3-dioxygenase-like lactoylglutathione lyase family enzyme
MRKFLWFFFEINVTSALAGGKAAPAKADVTLVLLANIYKSVRNTEIRNHKSKIVKPRSPCLTVRSEGQRERGASTTMKTIKILLFIVFGVIALQLFAQQALSVEKVSMTVSDLDRSVKFYTEVLDFQKENEYTLTGQIAQKLFGLTEETATVRIATMKIGGETLELMQFTGAAPGRPIPADSRSNDAWFQHIAIVVSDMDQAYRRVREAKVVHVSSAPQTLPDFIPAAAGISAFYFRDPDGHNLELIHFPKDKGNAKWQIQSPITNHQSPFLGIDHTAIGIEDTDAGYTFWRDALGLEVGGHSENYGTEQEHLNQLFGARLFITGLHAREGFGVEFLDYIAPPGGRPYPAGSRAPDLWHWHTTLKVSDLEGLLKQLLQNGFTLVSKGIVQMDDGTKTLLVRDPDGHAVLLREVARISKSGSLK